MQMIEEEGDGLMERLLASKMAAADSQDLHPPLRHQESVNSLPPPLRHQESLNSLPDSRFARGPLNRTVSTDSVCSLCSNNDANSSGCVCDDCMLGISDRLSALRLATTEQRGQMKMVSTAIVPIVECEKNNCNNFWF